jgi:hypothetical protein
MIAFCNWLGEKHPVTAVKVRYFARFKKFPNLENPKDLNEKILYMKLFTDTTEWTRLADKYKVREYVKERGLERCLVGLYGVWYDAGEVDFDVLPKSFILKANNGCGKGSNLIVKDKDKLDRDAVRKTICRWLHEKHIGALAAEPQYKGIRPCVIAEMLLPIEEGHKSLVDYKIWCFGGKAHYIWTCSDRDTQGTEVMTYDRQWNPMPEVCVFDHRYRKGELMEKPENLDEMLEVAEALAHGFPCVRMDLYNIKGQIYFGEMTFTSLGGMMDFYTPEFLLKCGEMIDLNYRG